MEKDSLVEKLLNNAGTAVNSHILNQTRPYSALKLSPVAQSGLCFLLKEGAMNQRTLAKRMNVSGQAVSELMKKFAEKKLITRESGEMNNANIISLTQEGIAVAQECQNRKHRLGEICFQDFTPEELDMVDAFFDRIKKNLTSGEKDAL